VIKEVQMNPIKHFREQRGLSRREMALAAGIGYGELWRAEQGYSLKLHPQLVKFLRECGYPGDPLHDYTAWREKEGLSVRGRIKDGGK